MLYPYFDAQIPKKRVVATKKDTDWGSQVSDWIWVKDEVEGELLLSSQIDPFEKLLSSKEFRAHVVAGRKQLKKDPSKLIDLTDL